MSYLDFSDCVSEAGAIKEELTHDKNGLKSTIGALKAKDLWPHCVMKVDARVGVSNIREVDGVDLLGRDAVPPDPALFARNIAGKVVLETGAGGSIGSELCRQIVSQRPARLVLLDVRVHGVPKAATPAIGARDVSREVSVAS